MPRALFCRSGVEKKSLLDENAEQNEHPLNAKGPKNYLDGWIVIIAIVSKYRSATRSKQPGLGLYLLG